MNGERSEKGREREGRKVREREKKLGNGEQVMREVHGRERERE